MSATPEGVDVGAGGGAALEADSGGAAAAAPADAAASGGTAAGEDIDDVDGPGGSAGARPRRADDSAVCDGTPGVDSAPEAGLTSGAGVSREGMLT